MPRLMDTMLCCDGIDGHFRYVTKQLRAIHFRDSVASQHPQHVYMIITAACDYSKWHMIYHVWLVTFCQPTGIHTLITNTNTPEGPTWALRTCLS